MTDDDARRIERLLATLESEAKSLRREMENNRKMTQSQMTELGVSLTDQISAVSTKMTETREQLAKDEAWQGEHEVSHAHALGVAEGKALANKAMVALMGGVLALVTFVASLLSPVINRALGG